MSEIILNAEPRTITGKKSRRLRREGWVPAVVYGVGVESRPLQIRYKDVQTLLKQAGTSQLITVHITGEKKSIQALIRDIQFDPVHRHPLHLDLYEVRMGHTVTVEVPIEMVGESPIVEQRLGMLLHGTQTVEIECLPSDLIDSIELDLSLLTEVDQQINVGDLPVPPSITILSDPDEMVVRVAPSVEEELEEEVEEELMPAVGEPEVITKGRAEEEE